MGKIKKIIGALELLKCLLFALVMIPMGCSYMIFLSHYYEKYSEEIYKGHYNHDARN